MPRRLWALIQKEFIQIARDRRTLLLLIVGTVAELLLFAAAVHTNIAHVPMAVADQSLSSASRQYLNAFVSSDQFRVAISAANEAELRRAIEGGQASIGLLIPPDFANRLAAGSATVLMLVDGSSSFTAQSAYRSASAISQQYAVSLTPLAAPSLTTHTGVLYNPDMQDLWFITPAFIAILFQAVAMNLTSLAVVRERERGTIEALLVTPVRPVELMLAKTIPNVLIVVFDALLLWLVATLALGVPFRGNPVVFLVLSLITAGCGLALGLLISTVVQTQNQAVQLGVMVNLGGLFLAGLMFPTYALPAPLRGLSYIFPTTYFIQIARGMFLKGVGLAELWPQSLALLALLSVSLIAASRLFRQSLD
jgi:drug efflux transport system permease protein